MEKYYLVETASGRSVRELSALDRPSALCEAITAYRRLSETGRQGRRVEVIGKDTENTRNGGEWSALIAGGSAWEPSLERLYNDIPAEANWLIVRYDERWSFNCGFVYPGFDEFLKLIQNAVRNSPSLEVAYTDAFSRRIYEVVNLSPWLA